MTVAAPDWHSEAAYRLRNVVEHGDDYGTIANLKADELRDVLRLAGEHLRGLQKLVAIADAMWGEEREKVQEKSDEIYMKEFGHAGPRIASPMDSKAREYCYWRHRIGKVIGLPEAAVALGQRKAG